MTTANPFNRPTYGPKPVFNYNPQLDNKAAGRKLLNDINATVENIFGAPAFALSGGNPFNGQGGNVPRGFTDQVTEATKPVLGRFAPVAGFAAGFMEPLGNAAKGPKLAQEAPTAIQKLIGAIRAADAPREALDVAQSLERSKRAGQVSGVFQEQKGQRGYFQALSKLKGELTEADKRQFNPVALEQVDVDNLFNTIQAHPTLDIYEKVSASNGLQKLFSGQLPQPSQLSLMEDVFGKDLILAVREKRPFAEKFKDIVTETLNLPRTLITSLDMSAVLRQGLLLTASHPTAATKATKEMFRQVFSQKNFEAWLADLPNNPRYRTMKNSGLYISDPTRVSGGLAAREEGFMSNLAERIPVIGSVVRGSQRAYVGYLNKLRVDVFTQLAHHFEEEGIATPDNLKSLANFINNASGRGSMGAFERSAQGLNTIFFSPRLIASRFNMLNPAWYAKQTPAVRKEAIKTMAKTIGFGTSVLALAKLGGADVELDPRSTDFGKVRVGNTRWDIWGGFQQWVRVFSQLASARRKSTKDGKIIKLSKKDYPFQSRFDVGLNFFRGKLAPIPSLVTEILEGQKLFGEDITLSDELVENTIPLYLQDIAQVIDDVGPSAIFNAALPAFFGVGLQHYEETVPTTVNNPFNR